jgi:hypothetical protein
MYSNSLQQIRTQGGRRRTADLALACTAALASVALLTTGPAQARTESPLDTGGRAVLGTFQAAAVGPVAVSVAHVAGLYGVHVDGGWLLR